MNRLTYSVAEVAQILGVSKGLIYTQVRTGDIPSIKLGRKVVISHAVLEEIIGHSFSIAR